MVFEIIKPNGDIQRKEFTQMHFTHYDLSDLVEKAGFQINDIFGSFEGDPESFDSTKVILVAQK